MATYRVYTRTGQNWAAYQASLPLVVAIGLSLEEARDACRRFNCHRTVGQVRRGLKMEFTLEDLCYSNA